MPASDALVPSLDLVQRTLAVDVAYTISRMKVLVRLPGNPVGIDYRWVDETAVALMAHLPSFARVVGLRAGHKRHIETLVAWYRDKDMTPTFEMIPGHYNPELELTRHGFFHAGFHVSLIGDLTAAAAVAKGADDAIVIEPVATAEAMEDYLDAYVAGWGITEAAQFRHNVRPWLGLTGWSLYVARLDGRPAAAATLYVGNGVAYLADAATDPAFRRHGLHGALLRRRLCDAAAAGADLMFGGAAPFSASHRNMERAGLRVQFVRALWKPVG